MIEREAKEEKAKATKEKAKAKASREHAGPATR